MAKNKKNNDPLFYMDEAYRQKRAERHTKFMQDLDKCIEAGKAAVEQNKIAQKLQLQIHTKRKVKDKKNEVSP